MIKPYFEIDAIWREPSAEGEKDLADISMRLGDHILTRLAEIERKTTRDYFRASATTLAMWIVDNWWRLRWESIHDPRLPSADWRLRHELSSMSGGTLWPPLMIYSGGERVIVSPSIGRKTTIGPVQYLDTPVATMTGNQFESGIDRFFDLVASACSRAIDIGALNELVAQLNNERNDESIAAWRRLEACLGYDPDEAPEPVVGALSNLVESLGEKGVEEAAIAYPGDDAPRALHDVVEASRASNVVVNFDIVRAVPHDSVVSSYLSPWRRAEDAATRVRQEISRPRGPIRGNLLADILSTPWQTLKEAPATARDLPYAARLRRDDDTEQVAIKTLRPRDRRFELCRMLGDSIWMRDASFGVISRAKTDRQKFQRAFAQSLLCPFNDLRNHVDLDEPKFSQIEDAAHHFHVHVNVVRNLLVYKGILPRETLDDQLEAA